MGRTTRGLLAAAFTLALGCGMEAPPEPEPPQSEDRDPAGAADAGSTADAGEEADAGVPDAGTTGPAEVSFTAEIAPLFRQSCGGGCHYGFMRLDGTPEEAWQDVVNVPSTACADGRPRVKPGDAAPGSSLLMAKVLNVDFCSGSAMPLNRPPLPAEKLELIRRWIEAGAPKD